MSNKKLSGRAKRIANMAGLNRNSGLNLVSLMDIFTILVFFLLVSSGSQNLPSSRDVILPSSTAQKVPQETLVIVITANNILVQGKGVATLEQVMQNDNDLIDSLVKELDFYSNEKPATPEQQTQGYAVTIMGDEATPYELLRKIMASCRQSNYLKIAFAANQTSKNKG